MTIAVKKHAKLDITFLKSCPILLHFFTLYQIIWLELWKQYCAIWKIIGLICKLQNLLPRLALSTLSKAFVCFHLDYGNSLRSSPQGIVSLQMRVSSILSFFRYFWSNMPFIKGETITKTRFSIFTMTYSL